MVGGAAPLLVVAGWTSERVSKLERLPGRGNENYLVEFEGGERAVLRRYPDGYSPPRSEASIGYEHAVLQAAREAGLPAPRPLVRTDGATQLEVAGARYALFEHLPGETLRLGTVATAIRAAEVLASVHRAAELQRFEQRPGLQRHTELDWLAPERSPTGWFEALRGAEIDGEALPVDLLLERLSSTTAELIRTGFAEHDRVLVHGDVNETNLLEADGVLSGVLDWDLCQRESPVFDLAISAWQLLRREPDGATWDWELLAAFLQTYQRLNPLPISMYDALPACMSVFLLRLMLWRTRAFLESGERGVGASILRSSGPGRFGLLIESAEHLRDAVTRAAHAA